MKARLPKEYTQKGAGNLQQMAKQAQKLQVQMEKATEELAAKEYASTVGGGAVKAVVLGSLEVKKIEIEDVLIKKEEKDMLLDLILAAINEAIRAAKKEKDDTVGTISGSMNIPNVF